MNKILLTILILLPLTVTAVPVTIEREVLGFTWNHAGPVTGFKVYCNNSLSATIPDPLARQVDMGAVSLLPDSIQDCQLAAYITDPLAGDIEAISPTVLSFFTVGGLPKISLNVEAPAAPSNFGLVY